MLDTKYSNIIYGDDNYNDIEPRKKLNQINKILFLLFDNNTSESIDFKNFADEIATDLNKQKFIYKELKILCENDENDENIKFFINKLLNKLKSIDKTKKGGKKSKKIMKSKKSKSKKYIKSKK